MTRRIEIQAWGRGRGIDALDGYAMRHEYESPNEAVARSIARRTGLQWCGGPRSDGCVLDRGEAQAYHFSGTLGEPCPGGGWTPRVDVWFAIGAEHYREAAS